MSVYTGISYLPNRITQKTIKNGFNFKLMVVGESGLGKSTFINSLFLTDLYLSRVVPSSRDRIESTLKMKTSSVEMEEDGIKLKLTIVDTPGFADSLDNTRCCLPIVKYIEKQFDDYMRKENGVNRKNITDSRVHCCLYFINPSGHGLRPVDVECLRLLQDRVNVIPIIGKADMLTKKELLDMKQNILEDLRKSQVKIYEHPDAEEDSDINGLIKELKSAIPYAVIGSNSILTVNGKRVRGRYYPWGIVDIENPNHCDFVKVRTMLMTFMHDLIEVTRDYHYENYRAGKLIKASLDLVQTAVNEKYYDRGEKDCGEKIEDFPILKLKMKDRDQLLDKEEKLIQLQKQIDMMKAQLNVGRQFK